MSVDEKELIILTALMWCFGKTCFLSVNESGVFASSEIRRSSNAVGFTEYSASESLIIRFNPNLYLTVFIISSELISIPYVMHA